jgi:putative ABC transport system substrate-binding protein
LESIHAQAQQLVNSAPDVIVAHTSPAVAALKQAAGTIPIVFAMVNDPVGQGLVANLARPGGNIAGFTLIDFDIVGKWLEMLTEMAPATNRAALMFNPAQTAYHDVYLREFAAAPKRIAGELVAAPVRDVAGIEATITALAREPGGGLIVTADAFNFAHRALIIALAARHRLPAIYYLGRIVREGGLMSYGPDGTDIFRRSASYVDRILKGEKPADLPVQNPTKFELAINFKTAKELGLEIPPTLLARADEVIE